MAFPYKLNPFDSRPAIVTLYAFEIEWPDKEQGAICRGISLGWGYRMEEVMDQVKNEESLKHNSEVNVRPVSVIPLTEIIDRVDLNGLLAIMAAKKNIRLPKTDPPPKPSPAPKPVKLTPTPNSFIWGLQLCRDRYKKIFTAAERKSLDRIIKKVENKIKSKEIVKAKI